MELYLFNSLKYRDGLDTVVGNLDLKLDVIQEKANSRDDLVRELDEAHTSTANEFGTMIFTV